MWNNVIEIMTAATAVGNTRLMTGILYNRFVAIALISENIVALCIE